MRRRKRNTRLLSLLLCLAMLMALLPTSGLPVLGTAEETDISNEVYIVDEDITKRGEYEKHFLCSDGTYRAVTYAEPVHYYDSSTGTWQDNDVALTLNAASTRYEAQSGSFAVSFAKSYAAPALSATGTMGEEASNALTTSGSIAQNAAASQTVTMSNGIYPISWTTAVKPELSVAEGTAIQKSAALGAPRLLTRTPAASILTSAEAEAAQSFAGKPISDSGSFAAANRISVAEYGNIAQTAGQSAGVSLRYSVSQHKIKEDIVISNKSAVTDFVTTLDVGALTAVKQEDGSVLLVDEYGDTAYTVGVPFMYDADYNVSYNVAVTVGQTGSVCRITYAPDREWLNAAVYPVVLDPTVTSSEYYANIVDTYVTQADSNNHSGEGNLVVGIKNGKLNRAYLRINNLPAIPAGVTPTSAQLLIKHGANTTSGRAMTLYRVNSSWSPSSITYSNQPSASTSIGSCAFNTSNVRFTFSQSQIQDLYTRVSNNTNYGFQIRYTSESTTNPDYNMLRSMEYPTASEQPAFTVTYAYTLPESLSVGEIYLFRNAGSGKYMDVQNGTDANDTNVIQWGWNGSLAQQFKLEQSSTGNGYILRSQVGGKTRVLDIYKTNGRRVENGNNVQIYRNVDPKAQEWLILPVDADNFRIVPRSNMSLSLTSYGSANGTANGRTSTSAGNVFVSTYTGADNQLWEIYKTDRTQVKNDIGTVPSGTYYVNNRDTGGYLKRSGTSLSAQAGVILKNTVKTPYQWRITEVNDNQYTIQPANDLTKYLSAAPSTSSVSLSDFPTYWNARYGNNGGAIFTVTSSGKNYALAVVSGTVKLQTLSSTTGTSTYNRQVWRLPEITSYTELNEFSIDSLTLNIDESQSPKIRNNGAHLAAASDFTYKMNTAASVGNVSINNTTAIITALKSGYVSVTATHKVTGKTKQFSVKVNKNAIIVIPGIMGTKLIAGPNNTQYQSGTELWGESLLSEFKSSPSNTLEKLMSLRCNNSGASQDDIIPYNNNYGAMDAYKTLVNTLKTKFGSKYEVQFFAYDWRLSNSISAEKLETFINIKDYDKVVLVAHSMGGLVASGYLARNSANVTMVQKLITLGSPLMGVPILPYIWGNEDIEAIGVIDNDIISEAIQTLIDIATFLYNPFDYYCSNFQSLYEMMPTEKYFSTGYGNSFYMSTTLGVSDTNLFDVTTYQDSRNRLSAYLPYFNDILMSNAEEFHDSLYINNEHITNQCSTYYLAGSDIETIYHLKFNMDAWHKTTSDGEKGGDGTVPMLSALLGDRYPSRTYYINNCGHFQLAVDSQVIEFVANIIVGNTSLSEFENITLSYVPKNE